MNKNDFPQVALLRMDKDIPHFGVATTKDIVFVIDDNTPLNQSYRCFVMTKDGRHVSPIFGIDKNNYHNTLNFDVDAMDKVLGGK